MFWWHAVAGVAQASGKRETQQDKAAGAKPRL
jgi:hypothetical protein